MKALRIGVIGLEGDKGRFSVSCPGEDPGDREPSPQTVRKPFITDWRASVYAASSERKAGFRTVCPCLKNRPRVFNEPTEEGSGQGSLCGSRHNEPCQDPGCLCSLFNNACYTIVIDSWLA